MVDVGTEATKAMTDTVMTATDVSMAYQIGRAHV